MPSEPAELQILKQTLGHDLGAMVFTLNMMASSLAQQGQQIAQQAERIQQMEAIAPAETPTPLPQVNAWTGSPLQVAGETVITAPEQEGS